MLKSIKSSYKGSFCVETAFGQNVLLCTFIWPKCPGQNVLSKMSVAKTSVHPLKHSIWDRNSDNGHDRPSELNLRLGDGKHKSRYT